MRPHMAHIQNTLIKKKLATDAKETKSSYAKYKDLVEKARFEGYSDDEIIAELIREKESIRGDIRVGDSIYLQGVAYAQQACIASIDLVISELKGETNGLIHSQS